MKTKSILTLLAGLLSLGATGQIKISGEVTGVNQGFIYLQSFKDKIFTTVDSSKISDGKFSISANIKTPEVYGLTINPDKSPVFLYLDKGDTDVKITLDTASYYKNTKITGSKGNEVFEKYKSAGRDIKIDEFIKENPKSIVSAYTLYRNYAYRLEADEIKHAISLLDKDLQNTPYVNNLKQYLLTLEKIKIGQKAPDFTVEDTSGNPQTLSSHFGKYLLVDFWAAWCGPCRKENPNVVNAYNAYKDKGFDVYGVSLDRTKEAWLKAIEKDNLTWTHVSDLKYWKSEAADLYGVRAIPANFLLDPNGIIIAKNLKGEDLHKKLDELLNTVSGSK